MIGFVLCVLPSSWVLADGSTESRLRVGFASAEITPTVESDGKPVWLAGYGWGRRATEVHDPLFARTIVLSDGQVRVAVVSVDLVGLQYPEVERIRKSLPDFDYVVVSSTHSHEGPDTIGIWGRSPVHRGVDSEYLQHVVDQVAGSVKQAAAALTDVDASFGTANDDTLLGDSRLPVAKDGTIRILRFDAHGSDSPVGILVQWNCHPEALGSQNTMVTADFCYETIAHLQAKYECPIVYVTGAVGGLMAPPDGLFKTKDGRVLREGEFAYAEAYGRAVAELASTAIDSSVPMTLAPIHVSAQAISLPIENPLYRTARLLGVVRRESLVWTGDFHDLEPATTLVEKAEYGARTEVACVRFGELYVACIPGEIYPELVYGEFQDPVERNVDFPDAALEPSVQQMMPSDKWMLFGLANDEVGYIIPRRQWDQQPPYAYGRKKSQYGEINSCSSWAGPIVMEALSERIQDAANR